MKKKSKIFGILFAMVMVFAIAPCLSRPVKAEGDKCLTFTGTSDFSIETLMKTKTWYSRIEYSTDKLNWSEWDGTTAINSVNKVLYLRGSDNDFIGNLIIPSGQVSCSGDIRTLLNYGNVEAAQMGVNCFMGAFKNCTGLIQAPDLPATTLTQGCYEGMFSGCTNLTKAPKLPATTLTEYCYEEMFRGCTSLETAPDLPAAMLSKYCYEGMFRGCTSLKTVPDLPAATLEKSCCENMFRDCTSLKNAPKLPAATLEKSCYDKMFYGCTSLTKAPDLPAATLAESCYKSMFYGCTSLIDAPGISAATLAIKACEAMFSNCSSLKAAPDLPALSLADRCYYNMFAECTSIVKPPELPATTLANECYSGMFYNCTKLKISDTKGGFYNAEYRIPKSGTGITAVYSMDDMFAGTGGTFAGTPEVNKTYYRFGYTVTMTGGGHAAASGGELYQTGLLEEMTPVTFTADSDHYFEESEDITIGGITVKRISDRVVTVSGTPTDNVEIFVPDAVQKGTISLSKATVTGVKDKTYTGSAITQSPTVKLKGNVLKKGRDYDISYENNTNVGTASLIITGKGDYKDEKKVTFKIRPMTITKAKVTGLTDKTYTGETFRQDVRVKVGKNVLTEGKDYSLSYKNNKKVGKATITVKGKGNYSGTCSVQFKIKKAPNTLKVEGKTATIKESGLKNKKGTIAVSKIRTITGKGQGSLTYKKKSGARCLSVNGKGKVTVAKNTAKGTYTMKVKVKAAGNANYEKTEKSITVTVKVE
ncbi:MAG: leucine-rich repeat protein [Lachnospiraceae bacterium]|nr:leucine-rich repeat protein [Lachnospiraceae bacterium]